MVGRPFLVWRRVVETCYNRDNCVRDGVSTNVPYLAVETLWARSGCRVDTAIVYRLDLLCDCDTLAERLHSSRGLGRGPLKAKTRVRIPYGACTLTHAVRVFVLW